MKHDFILKLFLFVEYYNKILESLFLDAILLFVVKF